MPNQIQPLGLIVPEPQDGVNELRQAVGTNATLLASAALITSGPIENIPQASARANVLYWATDAGAQQLLYSDGTQWWSVSTTAFRDSPTYCLPDDTSPSSTASIVASRPIQLDPGQSALLFGVSTKHVSLPQGQAASVFEISTDHGQQGALAAVNGLTGITLTAGAYVKTLLQAPVLLSDGDEVAIVCTTPGGSLGPKVAPILRTVML